jgi:hypothetical protein
MLRASCRAFPGSLGREGGEEGRGNGAVGGIFGRGPMGLCKGGVRQLRWEEKREERDVLSIIWCK